MARRVAQLSLQVGGSLDLSSNYRLGWLPSHRTELCLGQHSDETDFHLERANPHKKSVRNVLGTRRASIMPRSPARARAAWGRRALPLLPQRLAVQRRNLAPDGPERGPRVARRPGHLDLRGGHVQGPVLAVVTVGEIPVRPMTKPRIVMTVARGLATSSPGFRQPRLDHGRGRREQRTNQRFSLTHLILRRITQPRPPSSTISDVRSNVSSG